MSDFKA